AGEPRRARVGGVRALLVQHGVVDDRDLARAVGGEPGAVAEAVRLHDEAHDGGPGGAIVGGGGHVHEGPVGGGRVDAAGRVLREGPAVGDAARDDGRADGAG